MLVSLYIRNFGPIGDEPFTFSMETQNKGAKNKDKDYVFETEFPEHPYLIKSAGIFGPNASGKSTVFNAIKLIKVLLSKSHKFHDETLPDDTFKLSDLRNGYSEIEIRFIQSNVLYEYGFTFSMNEIKQETLRIMQAGKNKKWQDIINREKRELHKDLIPFITSNNAEYQKLSKENDILSKLDLTFLLMGLRNNQLIVSKIANNIECDYFDDFMGFFNYIDILSDEIPWSYGIGDFNDKKDKIIKFLQESDFGVSDIKLETEDVLLLNDSDFLRKYDSNDKQEVNKIKQVLSHILNDKEVQKIIENPNARVFAPFKDGLMFKVTKEKAELQKIKFFVKRNKYEHDFLLLDMSSGTKTFFGYANLLNNVLEKGTTLFIDEIERSLHPYLTNYIVNLFNNKETNPKNAQLVFISHDVSLLDKRTLNPEQVYFTSKDSETLQSELYSLAEFKLKNDRDADYSKKYLQGIFGAVPNIT